MKRLSIMIINLIKNQISRIKKFMTIILKKFTIMILKKITLMNLIHQTTIQFLNIVMSISKIIIMKLNYMNKLISKIEIRKIYNNKINIKNLNKMI